MQHKQPMPLLMLAALGVVYGDIGTSPLYAMRESLHAAHLAPTLPNVLGVLSLMAWALILVVSLKYIWFILRADNHGEGGIFALTTLTLEKFTSSTSKKIIVLIGMVGAALFYGDSVITPAISVLGALEGLAVKSPTFTPLILPLALFIMAGLFAIQRYGTKAVGTLFGPVMLVWFAVLVALGVPPIVNNPEVLWALNPIYAVNFALHAPLVTLFLMGAVVLVTTGAEALYADMGHFGRKPIQYVWVSFVAPALLINYFGQGALLVADPSALENPFFRLAPDVLVLPLVGLALIAAVIAAQAVISGAFSLTQQAVQLGYLPRMNILHTNAHMQGQIYIPTINWLLFGTIVLVIFSFQNSSNLAAAYGIAVTGTMLCTTLLATLMFRLRGRWPLWAAVLFCVVFVVLDVSFLAANALKIIHGGWLPLAIGAAVLATMTTWQSGRNVAHNMVYKACPTVAEFMASLPARLKTTTRPARTAVFLTSDLAYAPPALMYNLTHNQVLHEQVIILKVSRARVPRVGHQHRLTHTPLAHGISLLEANFGFMETPNVPHIIKAATAYKNGPHLKLKYPDELSYFLAHHTFVPSDHPALSCWQEPLFRALDALSLSAISFFGIPKHQVVEIGNQIEV